MNENDVTISKESDFVLELLTENEAQTEFKEATSAIIINPAITWAKFILTDDKPNGNKQRVPQEEFANLIKSGIYMPIKMAKGTIEETHKHSEPIGVITNLREETKGDSNLIVGLAALWSRERSTDIDFIKNTLKEGKKIRLSWEILFKNSMIEDGIEVLRDVVLKASTIVGRPAYGDRTPILAVAAKGSPAYLDELQESAFLYVDAENGIKLFPFMDRDGNIDKELLASCLEDIEKADLPEDKKVELIAKTNELLGSESNESVVQSKTEENTLDELETLKKELDDIKKDLDAEKALVTEKTDALAAKEVELSTKEAELVSLREFKASIEKETAEKEKIAAIKAKFTEAGLAQTNEYFEEKKEFLLSLDEKALEFMLQELVAFSSKTERNSESSTQIPNLKGKKSVIVDDVKELAKALNAQRKGN